MPYGEKLYEGKAKEVEQMTKDALADGRSVQEVLSEGLIAGMSVVGEDFKHNILCRDVGISHFPAKNCRIAEKMLSVVFARPDTVFAQKVSGAAHGVFSPNAGLRIL